MTASRSTLTTTVFLLIAFSINSLANQTQKGVKIFNTSIQHALANYDAFLHKPRNALKLSSGSIVRTCLDYIAHTPPRAIPEGVNNQTTYQDYLICDTVEFIQDSASDYEHISPSTNRGKVIAERLDLRSFPSSLGPRITDDKFTLSTLAADDITIHNNTVETDSKNWIYKLEIVAAGDFNNNDKEDWLAWLTDESNDGNYHGYSALLLYDPELNGTIRATPLPQPTEN